MWKDHSPWQIYTNRIRDLHEFFLKLANMVWSLKKNPTENHEFPRFQLPFVGSLIWLFLLVWIQVFIPMAFLQYMEKYSMLMSTEIFLNSFEIFHICIRDWPEIGPRSVTVLQLIWLAMQSLKKEANLREKAIISQQSYSIA